MTLGIQNHHDIGVGYESFSDLIRAVDEPNCKAMFDAWAPALHGDDLVAAAHKLGPFTVQTTVANYQRRPRYHYNPALVNYSEQMPYVRAVPIEEGFVDYARFLTALSEVGFEGAVAYEMCSPLLEGGSLEVWTGTHGCLWSFSGVSMPISAPKRARISRGWSQLSPKAGTEC